MSEQIVVSFSEIDTYRQCPLKHEWAYKQRWKRPVEEASALAKGSLWHLVLETHYNVLAKHDRLTEESQAAAIEESLRAIEPLLAN